MPSLTIATDGSAIGNPGPAGWAWYATPDCWAAGGAPRATNNWAELTAIRQALASAPAHFDLEFRVDSQYSLDAITKWRFGWARNGWKTKSGAPVANRELIEEIGSLLRQRSGAVTFVKVRAHQASGGDPLNEAADARANAAARAYQRQVPVPTGPGYTA